MKEEALKLAEYIDANGYKEQGDLIRKLVAELDKQTKPLSNEVLLKMISDKLHYSEYGKGLELAREIEKEHGIK